MNEITKPEPVTVLETYDPLLPPVVQSLLEAELTKAQTKQTELYTQLEANLTKEMETKKQFMATQLDTKLADAIGSFLTETLGKNVDLGAQGAYLTAMLEAHKEELKNEVST